MRLICGAIVLGLMGVGGWVAHRMVVNSWRAECLAAQEEHRWTDLEKTAGRWAGWQPDAADAWLYLADAVQHQHRFSEAADFLSRVPPTSEKYLPALQARIQILGGPANRPLEGEIACQELLRLEPRATLAHESLIQFYALTHQGSKLRKQILDAIQAERESQASYVYYFIADSLRLADGVSINTRWLATDPDSELFQVARVLQREGSEQVEDGLGDASAPLHPVVLSKKEQEANELLKSFPHNTDLLAYIIDQEIARGRTQRVLELLRQAPKSSESDGRFWRFKGWVHQVRGEAAEAEKAYRHALSLVPMDWLALSRLTDVLRSQNRTDEVARLQMLVHDAQTLRRQIRDLTETDGVPEELLRALGKLAKGCGDIAIADGLAKRLGPLDDPAPARRSRTVEGRPFGINPSL